MIDQHSPDNTATASDILTTVIAVLHADGRATDVDQNLETFEVARLDGGPEPLVGVVMRHTRSVVVYAVHPVRIPEVARAAAAEFATRQNTLLSTAAFELDLDTGVFAVRSGLAFPEAELDPASLQAILGRLLGDVERISRTVLPALDAALEVHL